MSLDTVSQQSKDPFGKLVLLMERLRGPDGCPWDREQTHESLKPMLIEEAFEVLEALDDQDPDQICEELGDLLFQVVFHSQIARENGEFDAYAVCRGIYDKMVRRHPHVFGDASFEDSNDLLRNWEDIKAAEKKAAGRSETTRDSLLDGIPEKLPALYRANQMTAKAARVGFDWTDIAGIREKLVEECNEVEDALEEGDPERVRDEVGDVLFTAVNLCRHLELDPETTLRRASDKFSRRFRKMESHFRRAGRDLKEVDPGEMETFWQSHKETSPSDSTSQEGIR